MKHIIQNHKMKNFDLLHLIKEADSDYEEYVNQSMPGIDNKDVRISTVLGYKGHDDFSSHPQKTKLYQQALLNLQQGVEKGDIKSGDIPEEFRKEGLKRKSPEPKKEPTAEPEKEPSAKDFDDELADLQDFMAAQPMPDEDDATDDTDGLDKEKKKANINSPAVVKQADEILRKDQPKLSPEQAEKAENKEEFLTSMVDAILADPRQQEGAGRFRMSRDDLEKYQGYLEGEKPEVPQYKVSDEELDGVLDNIKDRLGKDDFKRFVAKMARKGDPPTGMANVARSRAVIQDYIEKGGVSAITGDHVPFFESQLDHRVSLDNGGVDGGKNWDWMEARFNQFKGALTDEEVMENIEKKLSRSPEEDKLEILQAEYKNVMKKSYVNYFEKNGVGSVSREDIEDARGDGGIALLKAMAVATKTPYYAESAQRASGRAGGGKFIGGPALKERLIKKLKPMTKNKMGDIDKELTSITDDLKSKEAEMGQLKTSIKQQRASKKETTKVFGNILNEMKQNSLRHHWAKAEEDYPAHYFIREINEGSLI
jgi:hypothetical protein